MKYTPNGGIAFAGSPTSSFGRPRFPFYRAAKRRFFRPMILDGNACICFHTPMIAAAWDVAPAGLHPVEAGSSKSQFLLSQKN